MNVPRQFKEAVDTVLEKSKYMGSSNPKAYHEFQDYLSQKFTAAYFRAESADETKRLSLLWKNIINNND